MSGNVIPSPVFRAEDGNGNALSGGKLYSYQAGTSTLQSTYTDSTLSVANANPVILNSRGEAQVWIGTGTYKFVLQDSSGNQIWSVDQIANTAPPTNTQWIVNTTYTYAYISATQFSIQGDVTSTYKRNRRLRATVTAGTIYGTIVSASYSNPITTITVQWDGSSALDSGLTTADLSLLATNNDALPRTAAGVWIQKNANYTAMTGDMILVDTSGGPVTITAPVSTAVSTFDWFMVADAKGTFATNAVTIAPNGNTVMGNATGMTASTNNVCFGMVLNSSNDWRLF